VSQFAPTAHNHREEFANDRSRPRLPLEIWSHKASKKCAFLGRGRQRVDASARMCPFLWLRRLGFGVVFRRSVGRHRLVNVSQPTRCPSIFSSLDRVCQTATPTPPTAPSLPSDRACRSLRKPPVNRSEQFARFAHLALVAPKACELGAHDPRFKQPRAEVPRRPRRAPFDRVRDPQACQRNNLHRPACRNCLGQLG
jgi:hypothetical protein